MAAATNWKRPWEGGGGDEYGMPPRQERPPSSNSFHQRLSYPPSNLPPSAGPGGERRLPPIRPPEQLVSPTSIPGPTSTYRAHPPACPGSPAWPHSPTSASPKRPRLHYEQDRDPSRARPRDRGVSRSVPNSDSNQNTSEQPHTAPNVSNTNHLYTGDHYAPLENHRIEMSTHERPRAPPAPRKTCAWCDCDHCRDQGKLIQEAVFRLYHLDADLRRGVNGPPLQVPVLDVTQVGKPQALRWMIETLQTDQIVIQDVLTSRPQPPPSSHKRVRSDSPWEAPNRSMGEPNGPPATNDDRRRSNAGGSCPPQKVPTTGPAQSRGMLPSPSSLSLSTSVAPNTLPPISPASSQASQSVQAAHFQDLQHQVSTKTLALQTLQQEHDSLLSAFSRAQSRCATLDKKSSVSDSEINNLTDERLKLQHQVLTLEAQVEELVQSRDEARKQSVANGGQYMQIMSMASRLEAQGTADKKLWKAEKEEWEKEKAGLAKRIAQLEKDKEEAVKLTLWPESKYYVSGTPPTLANESKAYQDEVEAAAHGREREREQNSSARSSLSHSTRRDSSPSHSSSCRPAPSHRVPVLSTNASYSSSEHTTANGTTATGPTTTADSSINLSTASPDALRTEIHRLRKSCHAMDVSLHDLKSEGHRINGLMQKFANIGRRITFQADRGVRAAQRVDENLGEDVKELVGGLRAGDGVTAGAEEGLAGLA